MLERRRFVTVVWLAALASVSAVASCASDEDAAPGPKPGSVPGSASDATQRGRVIVARSEAPLDGATVTIAGRSVTTAADGTYAIQVPRGTPYVMTVSAPEHYKLLEQEWSTTADVARGDTNLLPFSLGNLLASLLPNRDSAKGVLAVRVYPVRGCADEGGTTLEISPSSGAQLRYFAGGIPSGTATSVTKGEGISAVFYNVDPGVPLEVKATSPSCTALGFPISEDGVTYTGLVRAEAGDALAYVRVFLGARSGDASTD